MKLTDLEALPAGSQLITTNGARVTLTGMARQALNGRTYTVATVRLDGGRTGEYKPGSLRQAADLHPLITVDRGGLTGHSITVERVDAETAQAWSGIVPDWRSLTGRRAVVERHDGHLGKVCCIAGVDGIGDDEIEPAAESTARTYGARYVHAGT